MNLIPAVNKESLIYEYDNLQKAAESSPYNSYLSSPKFNFIKKFFSKNGKKKSSAKNFQRPIIKPKTILEAQIPDENLSDPDELAKINNAGVLFIKLGECQPISKFSHKFIQKFKPLSNTVSLVNEIIASLNPIHVVSPSGVIGIEIEADYLRIPLLQCFTVFLKLKPTKTPKKFEWQSPLIVGDKNAVAWLKCDLEITVKSFCMRRMIEVELHCFSFYFSTIKEFNDAISEAEAKENKELKEKEGTLL